MAQNVTQYCHVCKSQTTSGLPVHFLEVFALWSLKLSVVFVHVCWLRPGGSICSENILSNTRTGFHHIFKHLEVLQKYFATRRIFNSLLGVWKCAQARSFVFDVSLIFKKLITCISIYMYHTSD